MKKSIVLFLLCTAVCTAQVFSQTIKIGIAPTALNEPDSTTIVVGVRSVTLPVIYTLFTDSVPGGCKPGSCNALPLMLLTFTGKRIDINNVLLNWKTTNEINNAGFDVERSLGGGQMQFQQVAFVKGLNGGSAEDKYQLPDANGFMGTSYYRLKQIDDDGNYVYSNVIAINNTGTQSLQLYPNPAGNTIYMNVVIAESTEAQVYFSNTQGKIVISMQPFLTKGNNMQQVQLSKLVAGTYFVKLITKTGTTMLGSFVKQ